MIDKTRELALKTLYQIDTENAYSNIVLDKIINENRKQLTDKDLGLILMIILIFGIYLAIIYYFINFLLIYFINFIFR